MRVFIAGSTGVLGRRLVSRLAARDHDVIGLVRDDRGATLVRERGGEPRRGDILERDSLAAAAEGADVVIHAATAIPTEGKPAAADWERNDRVRLEGAENLLAAAESVGASRFLLQSIVWVARQPDGSPFDEDSTPHPDRTTRSALEAERRLASAAANRDLEGVTLRCGWFYAHDSAHTRQFGRLVANGRMPIPGGGLLGREDATLSFCHVDDAADAFAAATEGDATGRYHVVDEEPTTLASFLRALADRLDASPPRRLPGWLLRPVLGKDSVRLLTSSMPTTNDRFREAFDWEPAVPTVEAGIDRVVDRWLEEGTIRPTDGGDGYEWVGDAGNSRTAAEGAGTRSGIVSE